MKKELEINYHTYDKLKPEDRQVFETRMWDKLHDHAILEALPAWVDKILVYQPSDRFLGVRLIGNFNDQLLSQFNELHETGMILVAIRHSDDEIWMDFEL